MKTRLKSIVTLGACVALAGCKNFELPEVAASEVEYRRSDPFGGTQISATGVKIDKAAGLLKADSAEWSTTYPSFSINARVKDYEQKLKKQP